MKTSLPIGLLAASAALLPVLALFAHKGIAPLFAVAAVAALAATIAEGAVRALPRRLAAAVGVFIGVGALSAFWSLTPAQTLRAAVPLAGLAIGAVLLIGVFARLDGPARRTMQTAILIGGAVGFVLLGIEYAFDRPIQAEILALAGHPVIAELRPLLRLNTGATVMTLFAWPWVLVLRHRFSRALAVAAGGAVLALLAGLLTKGAETSFFAFALGATVFFVARRFGKSAGPLLGAAIVAGMLGAPWIPGLLPNPLTEGEKLEGLSNSAVHRIQIWQTTASHIRERPWFGHGLDTARALYPQESLVVRTIPHSDPKKIRQFQAEPIPLHPHNMILQIWLETGLVGALLTLTAFLLVVRALYVSPLQKTERAAGYGFFVSALFIASISYGAWQAWWLSVLWLTAALMIAAFSRPPTAPTA